MALISISMIYIFGLLNDAQSKNDNLFNDIQNQIYDIKSDFEFVYEELESYKNELSNANYDDNISDIYNDISDINNKINELYEIIESYKENSNIETEKEEQNINEKDGKDNKDDKKEDQIIIDDEKEEYNIDNDGIYKDMYDMYYGRLYIPDLNISVALYYGYEQYITDRADSANIFFFGDDDGFTIADHNNQEFSKLLNVKVGVKGYIEHKSFGRINIECIDVFDGYNNGRKIVDENGVNAMDRNDYMMYTCKKDSKKVLICLWEKIS